MGPNKRIFVIAAVTSGEYAGCDVVLEQLLVDRVDNIRNNLTDKILTALEDCEIIWRSLDTAARRSTNDEIYLAQSL